MPSNLNVGISSRTSMSATHKQGFGTFLIGTEVEIISFSIYSPARGLTTHRTWVSTPDSPCWLKVPPLKPSSDRGKFSFILRHDVRFPLLNEILPLEVFQPYISSILHRYDISIPLFPRTHPEIGGEPGFSSSESKVITPLRKKFLLTFKGKRSVEYPNANHNGEKSLKQSSFFIIHLTGYFRNSPIHEMSWPITSLQVSLRNRFRNSELTVPS